MFIPVAIDVKNDQIITKKAFFEKRKTSQVVQMHDSIDILLSLTLVVRVHTSESHDAM